ncbi:MAG: DUF1501 domain-containing protein [Planctomycetes bacterium]|nr:DUF1501 domain-containing protein [Planctomycetota bacterium]
MLSLFDRPTRLCDGLTRREMLRVGALGAAGVSLPVLLARDAAAAGAPPLGIIDDPTFGRAKNIIYLWLQGGPPQHETFDPKPDAPAEIRGDFRPIQTNVVGTHFCELLPRTARIADKLAIVRSLATDNNIHSASGYDVLTGFAYQGPNARTITPNDHPWFGSLVKMLKPSETLPPLSTVWIPDIMRLNENVTPAGQTGGFLGPRWDPDRFLGDPSDPNYHVDGLDLAGVPPLRLQRRMSLLEQVERHFASIERGRRPETYDKFQSQAYDLLTSGRVRDAFAMQKEPAALRELYGTTGWGQCCLLARRLVEAGVRLVHVNWVREPGDSAVDNPMWDTHAQNSDRLEDVLCPIFDIGFTALLDDLDQRGLLDETLVVAIGEFGRTPKINASGGRDHWGPVFSFAMAGAGIAGGTVYGASDKEGAYPARDRVSGGDLTATLFHLLGIDPAATYMDPQRREHRLTLGSPIRGILGNNRPRPDLTLAGGSLARVPPFDPSLLLNTEFRDDVPLRPTDSGSRPKGWRASPIVSEDGGGFGVRLLEPSADSGGKRTVAIGFAGGGADNVAAPAGKLSALLAQEMRSPRAGNFLLEVDARTDAPSQEFFEQFFAQFACRLVIFQFADVGKDAARRREFASLVIRPPLAGAGEATYQTFQLQKTLDSPAPGQNFSIGTGLGVAIVVEQTGDASDFSQMAGTFIRIGRAQLEFSSRTINDEVTV